MLALPFLATRSLDEVLRAHFLHRHKHTHTDMALFPQELARQLLHMLPLSTRYASKRVACHRQHQLKRVTAKTTATRTATTTAATTTVRTTVVGEKCVE